METISALGRFKRLNPDLGTSMQGLLDVAEASEQM
jgi:hypothetical protein